ncbi:MAG: metallophosphoesterase family protein [Anaerolineaceae bacterium]|nr:metallophosphoesterase family protein [Anaerolineaceae bacterium]
MRLAICSDIHGNLIAFEAVLADLAQQEEVDAIWCLGDLVAGGPRPQECIQRVRDLLEEHGKDKFKVIGGNTDRYLLTGERMAMPIYNEEEKYQDRSQQFATRDAVFNWSLSKLGWSDYEFLSQINGREIHTWVEGYGGVIAVHAVPGSDEPTSLLPTTSDEEALDALLDREGRLCLAGHTHRRMNRDLGSWRVVNPGSVGMSFTQPGRAEWALLTFENGDVKVDLRDVPYDVEAVLAEANTLGHPSTDYLVRMLKHPMP